MLFSLLLLQIYLSLLKNIIGKKEGGGLLSYHGKTRDLFPNRAKLKSAYYNKNTEKYLAVKLMLYLDFKKI